MSLEIERRFLVDSRRLPRRRPSGIRMQQGYLGLEPVVRVRMERTLRGAARAWLTVKGRGLRIRQEYEYRIPPREGRALLKLCGRCRLSKIRLRLGPWLLDRYLGPLAGLWIAEIELKRAGQALPRPLPSWLGREVTGDPRYTNVRLARAALARRGAWRVPGPRSRLARRNGR